MSGRTRIKLPWQSKITGDVDLNGFALTNLTMPEDKAIPQATSPTDVINRQYVSGIVGSDGAGGKIGEAEDGSYDDGLFTDFAEDTLIGTAVDRFNEILKGLAPTPAPSLTDIGIQDSGVTGKLSFGSSNTIAGYTNVDGKDVASTFGSTLDEAGIFAAGVLINGDIAPNIAVGGANNRPYPAKAFGDADQGSLHLEVNGVTIHSTDLSAFASGTDLNVYGSGFYLTSTNSIQFDSGEELSLFKYRTGTWQVNSADQRVGMNTVKLIHEYAPGLFRNTDSYEWVIDTDLTSTTFLNEALNNPVMTGSNKLSGVTYHTSGTVAYSVDIENAYKNTYSSSSKALDFSGTNVSPTDEALSAPSTDADVVNVVSKTISINNSSRLLNDDINVNVKVDRTVQGDYTSPGKFVTGFLVDNTTDNSSATFEPFNGEGYRLNSSVVLTDTSYGSGKAASSYDWDSNQHLMSGDTNHNNGLLISGGRLSYPSNTSHITNISGGDFSVVTLGPGGNPDYKTASGNRTYVRYFHSSLAYSNFKLNITSTGTGYNDISTGPSGENVTVEILAPDTTSDGSNIVWKDAVEPHNANDLDIGCMASTFGDTIPTNWGLTLGSENTSTSGNVILVKITAPATWSGHIEAMTLTWV